MNNRLDVIIRSTPLERFIQETRERIYKQYNYTPKETKIPTENHPLTIPTYISKTIIRDAPDKIHQQLKIHTPQPPKIQRAITPEEIKKRIETKLRNDKFLRDMSIEDLWKECDIYYTKEEGIKIGKIPEDDITELGIIIPNNSHNHKLKRYT